MSEPEPIRNGFRYELAQLLVNALKHPAVVGFDLKSDRAFNGLRKRRLVNRAFYGVSEAANHSLLWHALAWAPVLVRRRSVTQGMAFSAVIAMESFLVNGVIKRWFRRERPIFVGVRPHALRQPLTSSFPSGHATSAFCAAFLLRPAKIFRLPLGLLVGMVSTSRVHVRIHHASDVVAGALLGSILGMIGRRATRSFR